MAFHARAPVRISTPCVRQSSAARRATPSSVRSISTRAAIVPKVSFAPRQMVAVRHAMPFSLPRATMRSSILAAPLPALKSVGIVPFRSYGDAGASGNFLKENEVEGRVVHVVQNFGKVDASKVNRNAHFINDLGLDSLDEVELLMAIEDEFAIEMPDSEVEKIHTVDDAVKYIASHPTAK